MGVTYIYMDMCMCMDMCMYMYGGTLVVARWNKFVCSRLQALYSRITSITCASHNSVTKLH